MNFENRINDIRPAQSVEEIARAFFDRTYPGHGYSLGDIIFVDDQNPHGTGILEVAVVDQTRGQIESITVGWIHSVEGVLDAFKKCLLPGVEVFGKDKRVPMSLIEISCVHLICGCCGNNFKGDYKQQKQFGQDEGFGICKDCERYYT